MGRACPCCVWVARVCDRARAMDGLARIVEGEERERALARAKAIADALEEESLRLRVERATRTP